ncbi:MAG: hypothetical protein MUE73_05545 [Planctomycetes bacterium]|jgi:type II secretory pathway component PulJ|nr:hypothetical protein [Planctomycetota bacterium]
MRTTVLSALAILWLYVPAGATPEEEVQRLRAELEATRAELSALKAELAVLRAELSKRGPAPEGSDAAGPMTPELPSDGLDLASVAWVVEDIWRDGSVRKRSSRATTFEVIEYFREGGVLRARTVEPLDPSRGRTLYSYKFHPNGQLAEWRYIAIGIGEIAPAYEFYEDGRPRRETRYHPFTIDKDGAYRRANGESADDTEWFRDGRVKLRMTRDEQGDGTARRFLADGRHWYTETFERNVAVRREEHLTPKEIGNTPLD